jgi:hypothetical protein
MAGSESIANTLNIQKDISGSYVFDRQAIKSIENQILSLTDVNNKIKATIYLHGDAEIAGESLVSLLDHSLIDQHIIEGFSIESKSSTGLYSVRIRRSGSSWMSVFSDDVLKAQSAAQAILLVLKNARPWYSPLYRFAGEISAFIFWMIIMFICLAQAFEIRDPTFLWFVVGLIVIPLNTVFLRVFFRKVEFEVGLSGKKAGFRTQLRRIIGGCVILAGVVGLGVNWVWSQVSST